MRRTASRPRGPAADCPRNLPLQGFTQNQIWGESVALPCTLLAWTQMLALDGRARRWEPKRLRLRIFTCGRRLIRRGRRPQAPPRSRLAMGQPDPQPRSSDCSPRIRLISRKPFLRPGKDSNGAMEPRPPGATAGPPR